MTAPGPEARGSGVPDVTCAAPTCRRRPTVGLLCGSDESRLGQWLADIGADWDRLDPAPGMRSPTTGRVSGGGLASHRAPARLDVLVLTDPRSRPRDEHDPDGTHHRSVPEVLGSWASTVRDERDLARTGRPHVPADRQLLADHLDWIVGRDWVDDFYVEIRDLWAQLKAATGQHDGRRPVRAPHQQPGTGQTCGGPIRLDRGAAWCAACGAAWSGFELVRLSQAAA